jgi:DNA primase
MSHGYLDFRRLRQTVPIALVLASRGLLATMRPRGRRLVGPCPIHGGDNPTAFVVDLGRGAWFCFTGCSAGGDVIDLVRRLDAVGYREAAVTVAHLEGSSSAAAEFAANIQPTRTAFRPYTRALRLHPDIPFLRRKGILPATAAIYEVGAYEGEGWLDRCVAVRLHDARGQPLGYTGRHLDPADERRFGKWKVPSGLPKAEVLFGYHRLVGALDQGVMLVECPWAVLRLAQIGIPAVGLLGTQLSSYHRTLLARVPVVGIMLDGDPAGRHAAERIRGLLDPSTRVHVVDLPDGQDPDDLTDEALLRAASRAVPGRARAGSVPGPREG